MKDKDFAFPQSTRLAAEIWNIGGLTKREKIAIHALQGLLSAINTSVDIDPKAIASNAVLMADCLMEALDKKA